MEDRTLLSTFLVTTTADDGPGSLRQAILDADAVTDGPVTIDFDIPGPGVRTIVPLSPLPPITTSLLVDGTTQPGYAGTPLIAFGGPQAGSTPLTVSGGNVTIRGLALGRLAIDPTADADLIAVADAPGATSRLSLVDARGNVLVHNEGVSANNPSSAIDENLAAGAYELAAEALDGRRVETWTVMLTPSTAAFRPIPVGDYPVAIVAGDFNGDGRPDLAAANENSGSVSVLMSHGDGTFQAAVEYAVGASPMAVVAGDFTGDGRLDLVVADGEGVQVLLGNGDGTFQPAKTVATVIGDALVAGDFAGHGRLDLAVAGAASNTVSILLGNGDGTFRPPVIYPVGTNPVSIVAGDFTGDGHLDLAVADQGDEYISPTPTDPGGVSVLLGNGDGTFRSARQYLAGLAPNAIVAGDFAGNGRLDLAVGNLGPVDPFVGYGPGSVSVLVGNGDGSFQLAEQYPVSSDPRSIVAEDFAGDGHLDLAVVVSFAVSVLTGNGDGTFRPAQKYSTGSVPVATVAGEFTGDGRLDLAVSGGYASPPDNVTILPGNGDGTFQSPVPNGVPGAIDLAAGDFTGDGQLDLAVQNGYSNTISILLGNGDGTFQAAVAYAAGGHPGAIVVGDFNGDGRLDLAVNDHASGRVSVLLGNGDGTFQPAVGYPAGPVPEGIVAGDFNGDGHLDLATADLGSNTVSILMGNGDGTFRPPVEYVTGAAPGPMVAGDFNGDGKLDLAVIDADGIKLLLGNGDGTFRPAKTVAVGLYGIEASGLVAGDFNGDGKLDLAADGSNNDVAILLGHGDGTFQPPVSYSYAPGVGAYGLVAGDFADDGHLDLAVANDGSNTVSILVGNGDGSFQPPIEYATGIQPMQIVAGDFSGEGRPDLAVANFVSGSISVFRSNGDGTFTHAGLLATTPHATPLVADVNGDGTNDVLVVDGSDDILYRQGVPGKPGSFQPPITINPKNPSRDIAWLPGTDQGPMLASVDAHDNAVSFYAWRNGGFARLGSLATGGLPAQVVAADLNGDGGTDLVVRNAADGTLSVFYGVPFVGPRIGIPSGLLLVAPQFSAPVTIPVGPGISDVRAIDTTGTGRLDLLVTSQVSGQL
jgi:hypothetical protein